MCFLFRDVATNAVESRGIHRHCEIFVLPSEFCFSELILIYPKGRFALYQLHYLLDRLIGAKRDEAMNMIDVAVDHVDVNAFFAGVVEDVLEDGLSYLIAQERRVIMS